MADEGTSKEAGTSGTQPDFNVLYANDCMVVVNKPHDIAMDGSQWPHTVETWACSYMKAHGLYDAAHDAMQQQRRRTKQLKFVHQLDYATSGVLCLAFTKDMAARLAHCFEMRTTQKFYVALLHGHLPDWQSNVAFHEWLRQRQAQEGCYDAQDVNGEAVSKDSESNSDDGFALIDSLPCAWSREHAVRHPRCDTSLDAVVATLQAILYTPHKVIAISLPVGYQTGATGDECGTQMAVGGRGSRASLTHMHILTRGVVRHPVTGVCHLVTKVLLEPKTGRRHQLRVHCNALGFPILGDTVYMTDSSHDWPRMCLHAWLLRLPCAITASVDEAERVQLKKRRRRETRGLEDATQNIVTQSCWTEFVTPDPFVMDD